MFTVGRLVAAVGVLRVAAGAGRDDQWVRRLCHRRRLRLDHDGFDQTTAAAAITAAARVRLPAAVLIVSQDLDAFLELADRIVVIYYSLLVHEVRASEASFTEIGRRVAGH